MTENPNIEYERLTQDIYQTLHDAEGIKPITVKHNVLVEGKSGCKHQIDVYLEFEMVGEKHRVAIECKNYSSEVNKVSIGRIRDFFGVLHDIGNIKGIFVTKIGYQSGAISFADYYEISLKELRFPTGKDWAGRVKTIVTTITAFMQNVKTREPVIDIEWVRENAHFKEGEEVKISFSGFSNEIIVYNRIGERITDFHEMESKLPYEWKETQGLEYTYSFDDGFLDTPEIGKIKIKGMKFTYDVISSIISSESEGETIAKAILKDVKTGSIKFFDKYGKVK